MDIIEVAALIKIIVFGITLLLATIYASVLLCARRLRHRLNILIINICLAIALCGIYWMVYFTMFQYFIEYLFTERNCTFLFYFQSFCSCQVPFAFVTLTANRFFVIVYPRHPVFKTKQFIATCIGIQWLVNGLVSVPFATSMLPYCVFPHWLVIYLVVLLVVMPELISLALNLLIFLHVHSSSLRIHAQMASSQTRGSQNQSSRINHRDLYLLRHLIFLFITFLVGWGPIFCLTAIDFSGQVSNLVYTCLQIWTAIACLICIADLFWYHHDLRQFLKEKLTFYR